MVGPEFRERACRCIGLPPLQRQLDPESEDGPDIRENLDGEEVEAETRGQSFS
jgi:hypothetical protein